MSNNNMDKTQKKINLLHQHTPSSNSNSPTMTQRRNTHRKPTTPNLQP